jgi:hypothetical protein
MEKTQRHTMDLIGIVPLKYFFALLKAKEGHDSITQLAEARHEPITFDTGLI